MLELRRLRLLRELNERGTIAAVADALQFTPSAVSQQLAMLEREAGVPLLERAGRGVRLTDAALVLVEHAEALLERAALAEADLAAAAGTVAGRGRIAGFQSVMLRVALPAIEALARDAPRLRCEVVEAEPEQALPALALGDLDLVLGDEWQPPAAAAARRRRAPPAARRPVHLVLPADHPAARRHRGRRAARRARRRGLDHRPRRDRVGGDDPAHLPRARRLRPRHPPPHQRRHAEPRAGRARAGGDPAARAAAARRPRGPGVRPIAEGAVSRAIFAATRATDAARPSTQAPSPPRAAPGGAVAAG